MGGAIYWTLFTIWAIINAHHQKRLHIKWILVFLLLNILGYLIYYFTGIQRSSSEEQRETILKLDFDFYFFVPRTSIMLTNFV